MSKELDAVPVEKVSLDINDEQVLVVFEPNTFKSYVRAQIIEVFKPTVTSHQSTTGP